MDTAIRIVFALGALALGTSVALFALFRFERFVGVRYLERAQVPRQIRVGLVCALLVTVGGLALFLASRGHQRELSTVGVVVTLLGALASMVFVLLRIFSVFTTVSTLGVVLGVASLVVVLAVTSGFEREFQDKVLAVNAHLIITAYGIERPLAESEQEADEVMKKLHTLPGVVRMSKFSFSAGEVMVGRVGANLKGIEMADGAPELRRSVVAGQVDDLAKPASCGDGDATTPGRMFIGTELARRARVKLGDCVPLLVPFASEGVGAPAPFRFKIVGIFQMGFNEYDSRLAFVNLDDARRLANARQSVFGVELRFRDPMLALSSQEEVERRLGPEPRILDWKTLNHNLFMALTMQKLIIALVLAIIIVVAAVNIVSSLTLIVLSKFREIAILNSMGARAWSLLRIFLVGGSFVGFAGTALGILYGLTVCGLARLYGYPLDPKVYLIAQLPVEISIREILFVAATTQLICVLATIYPAVRAARLRVVEGLRYL
ncbi:MAG TPA: FtsX-like permease family protein [Polyangia bacterium]|nr:FtsX-like permease family protein [Polyangia bacterium]